MNTGEREPSPTWLRVSRLAPQPENSAARDEVRLHGDHLIRSQVAGAMSIVGRRSKDLSTYALIAYRMPIKGRDEWLAAAGVRSA